MRPLSYLALAQSSALDRILSETTAGRRPSQLQPVFGSERLKVFASDPEESISLGPAGVVVGALFVSEGNRRVRTFEAGDVDAIIKSRGRHLVERFWGSYVAFLQGRDGTLIVVRDPSGGLPAYWTVAGAAPVFFSHLEEAAELGWIKPKIDWSAVAQHLVQTQLRRSRTAILDIFELLRGERATLEGGPPHIDALWSPWAFADRGAAIRCPQEATVRLQEAVLASVGSQASRFGPLLLSVSGGLDSSILATALRERGADFTCLTYSSGASADDEIEYARRLADHLSAPLLIGRLQAADVDLTRSACGHLPRPVARSFAQAGNLVAERTAADVGAGAYFNGAGGDNVFCNMQSTGPLVDAFLDRRSIGTMLRTLDDLCTLTGCSRARALNLGIRKWRRGGTPSWPLERDFLAPGVIERVDTMVLDHAWLRPPSSVLPGKADHVAMLLRIENHLEGFEREKALAICSPLLSQPLVEVCLRIPTWLWIKDGINRSIARAAFSTRLPADIATRTSHGSPVAFAALIYETNRVTIVKLLKEGLLARHGLLDLTAIETYLSDPRPPTDLRFMRLLALVDVESWCRTWERSAA